MIPMIMNNLPMYFPYLYSLNILILKSLSQKMGIVITSVIIATNKSSNTPSPKKILLIEVMIELASKLKRRVRRLSFS